MKSQRFKNMVKAKVCPYCNSGTRKTTQTEIYGREFNGRTVYCCKKYPKCDAYVGSHRDGTPLGRLANENLRLLKIQAHNNFDKLWRKAQRIRGYGDWRTEAYKWLSNEMGIEFKYTHIGMFNCEQCEEVIELTSTYIKKNEKTTFI